MVLQIEHKQRLKGTRLILQVKAHTKKVLSMRPLVGAQIGALFGVPLNVGPLFKVLVLTACAQNNLSPKNLSQKNLSPKNPQNSLPQNNLQNLKLSDAKSLLHRLDPIYGETHVIRATKLQRIHPDTVTERLTMEHVVPQSVITSCVPSRDGARSSALRDLHNMFACTSSTNNARGSMLLTSIPLTSMSLKALPLRAVVSGSIADHRTKTFHVHPDYRGLVARAVLYMDRMWGCDPARTIQGGSQTAWKWANRYKVSETELVHNFIAMRTQGTTNPFISNITDTAEMLDEIYTRLESKPNV